MLRYAPRSRMVGQAGWKAAQWHEDGTPTPPEPARIPVRRVRPRRSCPASPALDLGAIGHESVLRGATIDVPRIRERTRQRRLWKLLAWMLAAVRVALLAHPLGSTRRVLVAAPQRDRPADAAADLRDPAHRRRPHRADARRGAFAARALRGERDRRRVRRRRRPRAGERRGRQDAQPVPRLPDVPRAHGRQPAQGDPVRRSAGHRQDLHGEGDGAGSGRAVPVRVVDRVPVDVLRPDRPQDPQLLQGAAQGRARRGRRDRLHRGDRRDRRRAQRHAQFSPAADGSRRCRERWTSRRAASTRASPVSSTSC